MTKFAYRLETKRVKDPDFPYLGRNFINPEAVAEFCRSLQDSDVEKMIVLHLTTKNRLIGIQVFSGTVDKAVIHPRELVKQSLLSSAAAIILVHNLCAAPHKLCYVKFSFMCSAFGTDYGKPATAA
jgi:DNA repair protein RadC